SGHSPVSKHRFWHGFYEQPCNLSLQPLVSGAGAWFCARRKEGAMRKFLPLILVACASGPAKRVAGPPIEMAVPLIERETLFGDPELSGAQLSPDGKFISFRKAYKGVMNIWVKKREESFDAAHPISADAKRPVRSYHWTED